MQSYRRYGITMLRPEVAHLDLLRQWRNAPHVRLQMHMQDLISEESHAAWFAGLDWQRNIYLIFQDGDRKIGLVHVKDIDWEAGTGEAGVYTGDPAYLGSQVPVMAVLGLMDLVFFALGLRQLFAAVRQDNAPAMAFNRKLGYEPLAAAEVPSDMVRLSVGPERYREVAAPLRKAAARLGGLDTDLKADRFFMDRFRAFSTDASQLLDL